MAKTKLKTTWTDVDPVDYVDSLADPERQADARALIPLFEEISGEPARMWGPSIIGFGRYHYRYDSGHEGDAPRMGFAPRGRETVLYLYAGFDERRALLDRLGRHRTAECCLYIKRLADLDPGVLRQLLVEDLAVMDRKYPR